MPAILLAMLMVLGIGLVDTSNALTAPVSGAVIGEVATTGSIVQDVARPQSRRVCADWVVYRRHIKPTRLIVRRGPCVRWRHQ